MRFCLLFACMLFALLMPGCSKAVERQHVNNFIILDSLSIEYPEEEAVYSIELANMSYGSTQTYYKGHFDLIVYNSNGIEVDRAELNEIFHQSELSIEEPVTMTFDDYNNDRLYEIPIGFVDEYQESKYVFFCINTDGKLSRHQVEGYKENGFIYTLLGDFSFHFRQRKGIGMGNKPGVYVWIDGENHKPEPAQYIWEENRFVFYKDTSTIAKKDININGQKYSVNLIQTVYKRPLISSDVGFCIYESMYRGSFDFVVIDDSGNEISRLPHNIAFGTKDIGFPGEPVLFFEDLTGDGRCCFAIAYHEPEGLKAEFRYTIMQIDNDGQISILPCYGYGNDGYAYHSSDSGFDLLKGNINGFEVVLNDGRYYYAQYIWDGECFIFNKPIE
jgi:hypothetical protein